MNSVALSDDEAVYLAVRRSTMWPAPLPTIDVELADDMKAAELRGARSLAIRGLLLATAAPEGGVSASLAAFIAPITARRVALGCFVARDDMSYVANGLTVFHYATDDPGMWLSEVVSRGGVHFVSTVEARAATQLVSALLETTHARGLLAPPQPGENPDPQTMCCIGHAGDANYLLKVSLGDMSLLQVSVEGVATRVAVQPRSVAEAVNILAAPPDEVVTPAH